MYDMYTGITWIRKDHNENLALIDFPTKIWQTLAVIVHSNGKEIMSQLTHCFWQFVVFLIQYKITPNCATWG